MTRICRLPLDEEEIKGGWDGFFFLKVYSWIKWPFLAIKHTYGLFGYTRDWSCSKLRPISLMLSCNGLFKYISTQALKWTLKLKTLSKFHLHQITMPN